jgi:hypothetical protein
MILVAIWFASGLVTTLGLLLYDETVWHWRMTDKIRQQQAQLEADSKRYAVDEGPYR